MNLGSYSTFSKLENCHEIHLHNCCFFYFESCDVYFELIFMFSIYFCIILYHILSYVIYHYCINYFHLNSSVSFSALDFLSKIKNSCRFEDFSYNFKAGLLYLETKSHTRKCCPLETQEAFLTRLSEHRYPITVESFMELPIIESRISRNPRARRVP